MPSAYHLGLIEYPGCFHVEAQVLGGGHGGAKGEVKVKGEREEGKGRTKRRQETEDRTLFTSAMLL